MRVHFKKTGERRYGVWVEREKAPTVMMHPAPGFDDYLPHDLLHFVADAEWGIDEAVFGQLAAGGDAGRFWPVEQHSRRHAEHDERLERVLMLLDALARRWHTLRIGGVLTLDWPRPEGRPLKRTQSSASRATRRDGAGTRARSGGRARA